MKRDPHPSSRLLLSIPEVANALGIGRTKVAELIMSGSLPSVRIGRCVRIAATSLDRWIEEHETKVKGGMDASSPSSSSASRA